MTITLEDAVRQDYDFVYLAEKIIEKTPLHYDTKGIWWQWDNENQFWDMRDEIDIMNELYRGLGWSGFLNFKDKIMTALKMAARQNQPQPLEKTWIQFADCVIDINTGQSFEPTQRYFFTNPVPYRLGDSEETPIIDRIFSEWVGQEKIRLLQEIAAYCLLPDYPIHRIFISFGAGRNGKGRYHAFIQNLAGYGNITSTSLERIRASRFEAANLYNKSVAFCGETNFSELRDTALLKALSGQDFLPAEFKGKTAFSFVNYAKILISTNSVPVSLDKTTGFYSRMIIIPFSSTFDVSKDILETIPKKEYDNFCRKSVRILRELLTAGKFTGEGSIEDRAKDYEEKSNPLILFIRKYCKTDTSQSIPFWKFFEKYLAFLKENKYREQTKKEVGAHLRAEGYEMVVRWHDSGKVDEDGKAVRKQWETIIGINFVNDVNNVNHFLLSSYIGKPSENTLTLLTSLTQTYSFPHARLDCKDSHIEILRQGVQTCVNCGQDFHIDEAEAKP